jgi:hypothetical protein
VPDELGGVGERGQLAGSPDGSITWVSRSPALGDRSHCSRAVSARAGKQVRRPLTPISQLSAAAKNLFSSQASAQAGKEVRRRRGLLAQRPVRQFHHLAGHRRN